MSAADYKFFKNSDAVEEYIRSKVLRALCDELELTETFEEVYYTDEDREAKKQKIADVVQFFKTHDYRPKRQKRRAPTPRSSSRP